MTATLIERSTMNKRVTAIVEEAKKLTPAERAELFDRLEAEFLGDQGHGTPEEIEAAWAGERLTWQSGS